MFQDHNGQTSLEFLTIVMVLILLAAAVTLFLTATFDVNYAIYETKNQSLNFITTNQDLITINNITYNLATTTLTVTVTLQKSADSTCPLATDYNYSRLESSLENKTKFTDVSILLKCI
jgi:uncharacterized protein (UPF0333 family)